MSVACHTHSDEAVVAAQIGRAPRSPWRVAVRCSHGFPQVIVSPPTLADGTPFPTYAWLTCPWLTTELSRAESEGVLAEFAKRVRDDEEFARRMLGADAQVRLLRLAEGDGVDPCAQTGVAGRHDPIGVKCLHARAALALIGVDDPVGMEVCAARRECSDARCRSLVLGEAR